MYVLLKSMWINKVNVVIFLSVINSFNKYLLSIDYVPTMFWMQGY